MHTTTTSDSSRWSKAASTVTRTSASASNAVPAALARYVDNALSDAFSRSYSPDPVIGADLIKLLGPLDSVRRRHGILIERALAFALATHERFDVQSQVAVPVSRAAIDLCAANGSAATEHLALAVSDTRARTVVLDLVIYDRETHRLVVASVKRGGGMQGGVAAHDEHIEQRAAAMILRTMIAGQGLPVLHCEPVIIDWYGRSRIVGLRVVSGAQLDEYFGVPIFSVVDAMTSYLTKGVRQRASEVLRSLPCDTAGIALPSEDDTATSPVGQPSIVKPTATVIDLEQCLASLPRRTRGRPMQSIRPDSID